MYFEDNDLCDRVHLNKRSVIEIPKSKMIHMQGLSSKLNFIFKIKLSVIHKVSECLYLKKNLSKSKLFFRLTKNFLDYFQRSFFNIIIFKPKKSFKNILRMLSIILFVTNFYKLLY
jgi:GT2 family glycosyltransferase